MDVTEVDMAGEFAEQSLSISSSSQEHRIVHFDLKGAPLKLNYYEWLFPLLKKWGATGILVEYEDMFPYQDSLSDIKLNYAYSMQDVQLLQSLAAHNELTFIPLVQTFGHFEFVLKQDKFRGLREVEQCPMTLCPSTEESFTLLKEMLGQVIEAHDDLKYFHIGADEVYHIGFCPKCLEKMELLSLTQVDLFLGHIKRLVTYLKKTYPKIQIIMWDDMFRKITPAALKESGIGSLVQPMVWYYQTIIDLPIELWTTYSEVFDAIWVASAYKGATGPRTYATEIAYHIENHKDWLKVVKECIKNLDCTLVGYALTGWQRYDHYAVLCELFPVGLPCLAICLLTITHGAFTVEVHHIASKDLNFKGLIHMNPYTSYTEEITCNFKGSEVFVGVHQLIQSTFEHEMFLRNERLIGWMTDWHVKKNYTNPAHLNHIIFLAQQLLGNLEHLNRMMETSLSEIFYRDTVEEWIGVYISPMIKKVKEVLESANKQLELGGRAREHLA